MQCFLRPWYSAPRFPSYKISKSRRLRGLLAYAYDLRNDQLSASENDPAAGDNVYEIVAKAEGDGARTEAEFREMMRALLADRFKLNAHFAPRERSVYRLVVDKGGLKLKEVESDDPQSHHGVNGRNHTLQLKGHLDAFTEALQNFVVRPIVNATGLTKTYDIRFEATPMFTMNRNQEFCGSGCIHGSAATARIAAGTCERDDASAGRRSRRKAYRKLTPTRCACYDVANDIV